MLAFQVWRVCAGACLFAAIAGAVEIRVNFTLATRDRYGAPVTQQRTYSLYRPGGLPQTAPAPMVLVMEASPNSGPATFLRRKADQAGFLIVSCSFSGNATGTPGSVWVSDNPDNAGWEDMDYVTEVIRRVRESDNGGDAFITGLSKGGHMALAYACARPDTIRAASSVDEFMGLTLNFPAAPVPVIVFQGTLDTNVPYTMVKDTVDAWRATNGLLWTTPVTTVEPSPRQPGRVSQATWEGDYPVALVTIIGGTHTYATPGIQTGYDFSDGVWAFFSRFLTPAPAEPRIVAQLLDNIQVEGRPASFRVTAIGAGPLRYQWQKNGEDIPEATQNWLTVTAAEDGAQYRAVVTNDAGSAVSAPATLRVNAAPAGPAITNQPQDVATVAGQTVRFEVAAAGADPLQYQWQKNGVNIAGATAAALEMRADLADCGASLSVNVTDSAGKTTASNRATLTVTPGVDGPVLLVSPARARTLVGQPATFSVQATGAEPLRYQWQKGSGTGNMADIPGATDATYTVPKPALDDHLKLFRCVVANDAGSVTSASEMIFVTTAPTAPSKIASPLTAAAQAGSAFEYTIVSSGGTAPLQYGASPLPDGLTLNESTGVISGTPAAGGVTKIELSAGNSAGQVTVTMTLTVQP
jgi:poly(3-hydroxybutyrate) depolymerase